MHGTDEFDDVNHLLVTRYMSVAPPTLPECVTLSYPLSWSLTGTGVFSWSVFRFYRASLFQSGPIDGLHAYALDLLYLRNLSAHQIVQTSIDEMIRLRPECKELTEEWRQSLKKIIPDVGLGDRLIGVFEPGLGVSFYSGHQLLGQIDHKAFADAFAAIWLDEHTRSPSLRLELLGTQRPVSMVNQA